MVFQFLYVYIYSRLLYFYQSYNSKQPYIFNSLLLFEVISFHICNCVKHVNIALLHKDAEMLSWVHFKSVFINSFSHIVIRMQKKNVNQLINHSFHTQTRKLCKHPLHSLRKRNLDSLDSSLLAAIFNFAMHCDFHVVNN